MEEKRDVSNPQVIFWSFVFIALVVLGAGVLWLIYGVDTRHWQARSVPGPLQETFPKPRLEVSPQRDLRELRQREDRILNTYGWADQKRRLARVPVQRAMSFIVENGVPERLGGEAPQGARK